MIKKELTQFTRNDIIKLPHKIISLGKDQPSQGYYIKMSKRSQESEWRYASATVQENNSGEIIDVVRTSFKPACHIKKISKTQYLTGNYDKAGEFLSDGIVYEVKEKEEQMRNRRSLRQIFRTLRQLIANNYSGGNSELFVTLTYAEQHNDPQKIYKDLDLFWKRLRYNVCNDLRYIAIVEPHASGNFHVHLLLADTAGEELYIPNETLERIWGQGYTKTERLHDINNMGAYFIAYFTNMELSEDEIKVYADEDDVEYKNGKAYIKGKRLDFYPENMRIYRHSKNCIQPKKYVGAEVNDVLRDANLTYSHDAKFSQDGQEYTIQLEQYRKDKTDAI